jgi:excisionase family DNA binding protein
MDDENVDLERMVVGSTEPMLTVHEAALSLRVSEQTVWRRVRAGELRAVQLGGPGSTVRIPCAGIRELLQTYAKVGSNDQQEAAGAGGGGRARRGAAGRRSG